MTSMLIEHILSKCKMPSFTVTTIFLSQRMIAAQTTINTNDLRAAKHVMCLVWDEMSTVQHLKNVFLQASVACKHQTSSKKNSSLSEWMNGTSLFFFLFTREYQPVSFNFTEKLWLETTQSLEKCKG